MNNFITYFKYSVPTTIFKIGDEIVHIQTGAISRVQLATMVDRYNG